MKINLYELKENDILNELKSSPMIIKYLTNRTAKHLAVAYAYMNEKEVTYFLDEIIENDEFNIELLDEMRKLNLKKSKAFHLYHKINKDNQDLINKWIGLLETIEHDDNFNHHYDAQFERDGLYSKELKECVINFLINNNVKLSTPFLLYIDIIFSIKDFVHIAKNNEHFVEQLLLVDTSFYLNSYDSVIKNIFNRNKGLIKKLLNNNKQTIFDLIKENNSAAFNHHQNMFFNILNNQELMKIINNNYFNHITFFELKKKNKDNFIKFKSLLDYNKVNYINYLSAELLDHFIEMDIINNDELYSLFEFVCNEKYIRSNHVKLLEIISEKIEIEISMLKSLFNKSMDGKSERYILNNVNIKDIENIKILLNTLSMPLNFDSLNKILNKTDLTKNPLKDISSDLSID